MKSMMKTWGHFRAMVSRGRNSECGLEKKKKKKTHWVDVSKEATWHLSRVFWVFVQEPGDRGTVVKHSLTHSCLHRS